MPNGIPPQKSPGNIQHWTFDAAAAAPMLSSLPLFLFIVHCCCRCKRKLQLPHNLFNALLQNANAMRSLVQQLIETSWFLTMVGSMNSIGSTCYQGFTTIGRKCVPHHQLREGFWKKVWSFAKPGGGVSEGKQKTKPQVWKCVFFSEHWESFWDPQNMFYTWSGVPRSFLKPLK